MVNCSVFGCDTKQAIRGMSMHVFPDYLKNRERFEAWVKACGNSKLFDLKPCKLSTRYVCRKHFKLPHPLFNRLPKDSVPELYVPAPLPIPIGWLEQPPIEGDSAAINITEADLLIDKCDNSSKPFSTKSAVEHLSSVHEVYIRECVSQSTSTSAVKMENVSDDFY